MANPAKGPSFVPGRKNSQDLAFAPSVALVAGGEVTTSPHIVGESLPLGSCLYGDEGGCRSDVWKSVEILFFVLGSFNFTHKMGGSNNANICGSFEGIPENNECIVWVGVLQCPLFCFGGFDGCCWKWKVTYFCR